MEEAGGEEEVRRVRGSQPFSSCVFVPEERGGGGKGQKEMNWKGQEILKLSEQTDTNDKERRNWRKEARNDNKVQRLNESIDLKVTFVGTRYLTVTEHVQRQ